jgi:protein-S-isoprenylcysteine O-methyltransferase Ste14
MTDSPRPLVRLGNFVFRTRNGLFPVIFFAMLLGLPPVAIGGSARIDHWFDLAAILVAMSGQVLRLAVIGFVYIIRGGKDRRIYAEGLVTGGLFAHSRNPLYLGNVLILIGLFVLHGNPWVMGVGIPMFVVAYIAIVAAEEAYLASQYGPAYQAYMRDVPRWWPRLRGIGESVSGMTYNWRRAVLKEYGSAYAWTAGAVAVLLREAYGGQSDAGLTPDVLWTVLAVLTVAWLGVRILKKTRRLRDLSPTRPASAQ